jgi:predicted GH43/DUF377 family glycosyl hydrolase
MVVVVLASVAPAVAQTQWLLYPGNPVIPGLVEDEWPDNARWIEEVVVVDGTYHMFFTGTSAAFTVNHEVGHATSPDGIAWTMDPENPVMTPQPEGDWEVTSIVSLAVIHDGAEFRMWYGGIEPNGYCSTGVATSSDGSTWTRHQNNPVFEPGPPGSFDDGVVFPATVFRRNGLHHMWYSAVDVPNLFSRTTIGYATSVDGLSWIRHPSPVLEPGPESWDSYIVYGPEVLFDGSSYHMWFTGSWGYGAYFPEPRIGYATSNDGLLWIKDPGNPINVLGQLSEQPQVLLHAARRECEMFYNNPVHHEFSVNRATSSCQAFGQARRSSGRRFPDPPP